MRPLVLLLAVLLPAVAPAARADASCPVDAEIPIGAAGRCLGETRTVVGRLDHVGHSKGGNAYLNFCKDFRSCAFSAVVFKKNRGRFPDLDALAGADVAITGKIKEYKGQPQIIVEGPDQLVARVETPPARAPSGLPAPRAEAPRPPAPALKGVIPPAKEAPPPKLTATIPPAQAPAPSEPPAPVEPELVIPVPTPDVTPGEVAKFVGRRARVRGRVARFSFEGNDLVARFERGSGNVLFVAVVAEPDVDRLTRQAEQWDGRNVAIEGEVALYDGIPGIFVRDPKQVTVLGER